MTLAYNKICNLEDFADPSIVGMIREVFPHDVHRFAAFPVGRQHRKHWEVAMAVRTLRECGALRADAEILGIGAGSEPTLFWLTNFVRRVFATDLYASSGAWEAEAHPSMLVDAKQHWPSQWQPRRLVVQHMDALSLDYEDNSFEGIFSAGSIEHFGTLEDIARAAAEAYRVLKPGGTLSLSTEFLLAGDPLKVPGVVMFTEDLLREVIVGDHDWELVGDFDGVVSSQTRATLMDMTEVVDDYQTHRASHGGETFYHELELSRYPHIVVGIDGNEFTSVHLALRKRGGGAPGFAPRTSPVAALPARGEVHRLLSGLKEPLVLVDAGCRWGFSPEWETLAQGGARLVGFEPDAEEAARLTERYAEQPTVEVIASALGAEADTATLHHQAFDGGQSLHRTDERWWSRLALGIDSSVLHSTSSSMQTLDDWCSTNGVDRVDALKLDVQGHELAILKGSEDMLRHVRLIECEVCLNPLFMGTPLFGEVDAWLRERGFVLWRLRELAHYPIRGAEGDVGSQDYVSHAPYDVSTFVAGPGVLNWANAHYVAADWLDGTHADAQPALREALVANASRFHDLALLSLRQALRADIDDSLARSITDALNIPSPADPTASNGQPPPPSPSARSAGARRTMDLGLRVSRRALRELRQTRLFRAPDPLPARIWAIEEAIIESNAMIARSLRDLREELARRDDGADA